MLKKLFSGKKHEDDEVERIFKYIFDFLHNEETQNGKASAYIRENIIKFNAVDEITGTTGEFGRAITNPIPVNGAVGEIIYLSLLRSRQGMPIIFHRIGSTWPEGWHGSIDCYEVRSLDGELSEKLWLDFHFRGKSKKAPIGYQLEKKFDRFNIFYGTNAYVPTFPEGIFAAVIEFQRKLLGDSILPCKTVRAFCDPSFARIDIKELHPAYRAWIEQNNKA